MFDKLHHFLQFFFLFFYSFLFGFTSNMPDFCRQRKTPEKNFSGAMFCLSYNIQVTFLPGHHRFPARPYTSGKNHTNRFP